MFTTVHLDDGGFSLTSAWTQDGVAAEVCDLHHHPVINHTVGGLEASVHCDVTGVEIGHPLWETRSMEGLFNVVFPLLSERGAKGTNK